MKPIYIPPHYAEERMAVVEAELLALPWETKRTARHEFFMADGIPCDCSVSEWAVPVGECNDGKGYIYARRDCEKCEGAGRLPINYSYGRKDDGITYTSKPFTLHVKQLMRDMDFEFLEAGFNACFLNKYDDQHQHLGWTADDFAGMDPDAPIAVMSFGAEREIWVKRKWKPCDDCKGEGTVVKVAPAIVTNAPIASYLGKEVCGTCHGSGESCERVTGHVPPEDRYLLQRGSLFIMPPGFQEEMLHRIPKHPQPCGWRISLTFRKFL